MITPLKTPVLLNNQDQYHQQYERQGNLQRTLSNSRENFNSTTKKASWQAGIRESKETLSTNYSLKDELSTLTVDGAGQSLHDFTFHPSDIQNLPFKQSLPLKNQYKYSNKSIQCVIFYALIFNYLQLEQIKKNLPEITSISLRSYNLIKKSILNYDQILMKRQQKDYIFPHSAFRLIENQVLSLKNRKQWLKNLIDKIDSSMVSQLVQLLLNDAKADNLLIPGPKSRANINPQSSLQELVNCLGIRVKYQSEFKICSYGKKKSSICISLKQQSQSNVFSLKRVSCYEDRS